MTRRDWNRLAGSTWKSDKLRAVCRKRLSYSDWQFHVGIINSLAAGTRATFGALRYGLDARKLGDAADRAERRIG